MHIPIRSFESLICKRVENFLLLLQKAQCFSVFRTNQPLSINKNSTYKPNINWLCNEVELEEVHNNNISALGALKQSLSALTIMQIKEIN